MSSYSKYSIITFSEYTSLLIELLWHFIALASSWKKISSEHAMENHGLSVLEKRRVVKLQDSIYAKRILLKMNKYDSGIKVLFQKQ